MKVEFDSKKDKLLITIERNELIGAFKSVGAYNDLVAKISKEIYEKGQKL